MQKRCRICHMPITDWRNDGDVHPDCELIEDIQRIQRRNRFDGTGQDDEVEMEGLRSPSSFFSGSNPKAGRNAGNGKKEEKK